MIMDYSYRRIGQIPGQLYDAQVVDGSGRGLYAGWFYLDANGQQIMDDKVTDANGYFHFTVPSYNHENIFIQFYATEKYNPVIKTFQELVENPKVVLKKKSSLVPLLLIAGAAVVASHKNKSMGTIPKKRGQTIALIGAGAVALYFIFKYKPTAAQNAFLSEAKSRLDYLAKEYGIVPSLTLAQFKSLALQIVRSVDKCGTDEAAIYRSFMALNNEADFWQLVISFGIAKYDGCFEGSLPFWTVHYTLPESLSSDVSNNVIQNINTILKDKGINYLF